MKGRKLSFRPSNEQPNAFAAILALAVVGRERNGSHCSSHHQSRDVVRLGIVHRRYQGRLLRRLGCFLEVIDGCSEPGDGNVSIQLYNFVVAFLRRLVRPGTNQFCDGSELRRLARIREPLADQPENPLVSLLLGQMR